MMVDGRPPTRSPGHQPTKSPGHYVTKSPRHQVTRSPSNGRRPDHVDDVTGASEARWASRPAATATQSAFASATCPYQCADGFGVRSNVSRSQATSPKVGRNPDAHS